MGAGHSSQHDRSLPPTVRSLLEAADPSAHDKAWGEFVAAFSRLILYVARQTPGEYDTSMDRYAFVLERLREQDYRRLRTYAADGRGKFTTWLTVVVRRLCVDYDRVKHGRAPPAAIGRSHAPRRPLELVFLDPLLMDRLEDGRLPADEEVIRRQALEQLDSAVAGLIPSDRLLLVLRYEDGRSAREIASILSLSTPFHVYRRLNRVHDLLRRALAPSARDSPPAVQYPVKP